MTLALNVKGFPKFQQTLQFLSSGLMTRRVRQVVLCESYIRAASTPLATKSLNLMRETALFTETLDNLQHSTLCISES